jgi:hypothetical protein
VWGLKISTPNPNPKSKSRLLPLLRLLSDPSGHNVQRKADVTHLAVVLGVLHSREDPVFISYFCGLTHEGTKPEIHVLELLPSSLMGYDTSFNQGFVADSMLRIGFKTVRSRTLNTSWGPMELDIGKK